jgi:hypothetical protein
MGEMKLELISVVKTEEKKWIWPPPSPASLLSDIIVFSSPLGNKVSRA